MSTLKQIFNSNEGMILISIIWGLGLASLFRKACKDRACIVIRAPEKSNIQNNIYEFDNKCYKFKAKSTKCNK